MILGSSSHGWKHQTHEIIKTEYKQSYSHNEICGISVKIWVSRHNLKMQVKVEGLVVKSKLFLSLGKVDAQCFRNKSMR